MVDRDRNFAGPVSLSSSIFNLMEQREKIKLMARNQEFRNKRAEEHRGKRVPNVGFKELMDSARESKTRKASSSEAKIDKPQKCPLCSPDERESLPPVFQMGKPF